MQSSQDYRIDIDYVSIIRGIFRQWWVIVLLTIGTYMFAYTYIDSQYVPQYTTSTTFIVTQRNSGTYSSIYSDISSAKDTAQKFTQILNSTILQKKVAEELGMSSLDATVDASVISETNLIVLSVTAGSAFESFQILQSMLDNHELVSQYLLEDVLMTMIQAPSIPTSARNARNTQYRAKSIAMMAAVIFTVFFGGLGLLRDTVKSGDELKKKLDARLLGVLSYENKYKTLPSMIKRGQVSMLINNPILSYRYVENYQLLVARIRSKMKRADQKVLLVTSVMENEGKSTVAANIALGIANSGEKVLLIDCDMRKPAQFKIFGVPTEKVVNLPDVLKGQVETKDYYVKLAGKNLTGFLNTEYQKGSTELIDNGVLAQILEKAREEFDFIVVDSSPMALVADAEAISKYTDASALVVRQDFVMTKDINDTIDVLRMQKASFIGCVLNGVRQSGVMGKSKQDYSHTSRHHSTRNSLEER